MTVLVCGGREFNQYELLRIELDRRHRVTPITRIISGGARGADALGELWAKHAFVSCVVYPADWKAHGRAAGARRNQRMLDSEKLDLVVACRGGKGTADMMRRAEKAGITVVRVGTEVPV